MPQYCFASLYVYSCAPVALNSCALVLFLAIACFALHVAWCTLFLALFGGNLCESIALTINPSLPPFLYFFTVDSSCSSDSEKESLGGDVNEEEEEEEIGSDLDGMAPTPNRHRLAN